MFPGNTCHCYWVYSVSDSHCCSINTWYSAHAPPASALAASERTVSSRQSDLKSGGFRRLGLIHHCEEVSGGASTEAAPTSLCTTLQQKISSCTGGEDKQSKGIKGICIAGWTWRERRRGYKKPQMLKIDEHWLWSWPLVLEGPERSWRSGTDPDNFLWGVAGCGNQLVTLGFVSETGVLVSRTLLE